MSKIKWQGIIPAVTTPFKKGQLDLIAFEKHLGFLIQSGVHGIVVSGSTGEGATIAEGEFKELISAAKKVIAGRVPLLVGTGTNSTATTIQKSQIAESAGADALLIVTPYYNKPPQEGLFQHFREVAQNVGKPIVLYNVPGRTACNLLPETVVRLTEIERIESIKEASGSFSQAMQIIEVCGARLPVLTGEDLLLLPMLAVGCTGIISVAANLVACEMVAIYEAHRRGDNAAATNHALKIRAFCEAIFWESNPIPIKAALAYVGMIQNELRLPLIPMSPEKRQALEKIVDGLQLERGRS